MGHPAFKVLDVRKLGFMQQLTCYVDHFSGVDRFALGFVSILEGFINTEKMLASLHIVNVSMRRLHISSDKRFLLKYSL